MTHYPLILDDAGRNLSKRPGQHSDCSVRALAIVSGLPYDTVYDILAAAGRKPCDGFDSPAWIKKHRGRVLGGRFKVVSVRGLTPLTFGRLHPKGRFILETENHMWALVDGKHRDLWRVTKKLTGAWSFVLDKKGQST